MCFDRAASFHRASSSSDTMRRESQSSQESETLGCTKQHPNLEGLHIIQGGWGDHGGRRSEPITEGRISYKGCFEICGHLLTFCKRLVLWII